MFGKSGPAANGLHEMHQLGRGSWVQGQAVTSVILLPPKEREIPLGTE